MLLTLFTAERRLNGAACERLEGILDGKLSHTVAKTNVILAWGGISPSMQPEDGFGWGQQSGGSCLAAGLFRS